MPGLVRRVNSSLSVRDMAAEGLPLSPADKKRNKLGYHRTAVACGHCRRRKIRCIPAFDNPGGRCQNCIRLKKDCHFYPVDQQSPGQGKRTRSATKTTEGYSNDAETSVSSSSPGGILRSSSFEQIDQGDRLLGTPPLSDDSPGFQTGSRSLSGPGFDYPSTYDQGQHHPHQQAMIPSPYVGHSPRNFAADPVNSQYYQQYGHNVPGSYSSTFTTGSVPSNTNTFSPDSSHEYQAAAENGPFNWPQPPTRSMSTAETEELQHGFHPAYRTHTYPSFERRITGGMPHLPSTTAGLMVMGIENQQTPLNPNFCEPTSYQPLQVDMQHDWSGGGPDQGTSMSALAGGTYSQRWYSHSPGFSGARGEGDQHHAFSSQSHHVRRAPHEPG
ncbi:uncharacterized protein Z518_01495 [Rhinocladiella mackenziei CBS 650.93]|uniref:Zn(2)-C6 fungal-type domain-containing protein n=1 Tax=Rhinocladiella mackenziei CBS 650.93 TaxID=1442369 RepID=A0A0D2HIB1_9EURO|nr:uncharacterized protein Z518_01495 [Rhinocladiella mackenziei CBS 650.93]KIX10413.1 hypothetical protein Z518_01495 [Rhinocladiella mackenziei CBS 650.93]